MEENTLKPKSKKKLFIVLGIIVLIICICITSCVAIFTAFMGKIVDEGKVIKDAVLEDVCESHGEFSQTDYEEWFTSKYVTNNSLDEANDSVLNAFPNAYDCDSLISGDIIKLIKEGQSLNIQWNAGFTTAQVGYNNGVEYINIFLVLDDTDWKISGISSTEYSF